MSTDSSGNNYEEVEIPGGNVRLTYVQDGWANSPSIRVQIRDESGRLRRGPEIPIASVEGMIGAIVELVEGST